MYKKLHGVGVLQLFVLAEVEVKNIYQRPNGYS